jgi:hypothetical protein
MGYRAEVRGHRPTLSASEDWSGPDISRAPLRLNPSAIPSNSESFVTDTEEKHRDASGDGAPPLEA